MATVKVQYNGDLQTSLIHELSGAEVATDAPPDNNGKGRSFSPTDMIAASWLSCMMTIMAMKAENEGIDIKNATGSVEKIMQDTPRRIGSLNAKIFVPVNLTSEQEQKLINAAKSCPVVLSLHEKIEQDVKIEFNSA